MEMNTKVTDNNNIAKMLFKRAMKGEWNNVVEIYQNNPAAYEAKITRSGETALHLAVWDTKEDIVEKLVSIIKQQNDAKKALGVRNERGNTALHIAASLGSVRICHLIAEVDHSLIGVCNLDNETSLFLAALHGKKDAFLLLNSYVDTEEHGYPYCRRKDGQTILHCAIFGDYFDLAFQIIHLYEKLVNSVDEHGITPLHILASKPTAFKSGRHLGWGDGIIYHCIFVDDLKFDRNSLHRTNILNKIRSINNPNNSETCIHFFKPLKGLVQTVFGPCSLQKDAENPAAENRQALNERAQGRPWLPPNCHICFDFVKRTLKAMLIVLGLGLRKIKKLEKEKKKHRWSVQIMNELVQRASYYEYGDDGGSPQPSSDGHETKPYAVVSNGDVGFEKEAFPKNDHPQQSILSSDNDQNQEQNGTKALGGKWEGKNGKKEGINVMKEETSIFIAARSGIKEMVEKIQDVCPVAIHDMNPEKNTVLLVLESRKPHVDQRNIMKETPILIAAKCGITEMVEKILEVFPVAIHDMNSEKKNIVLLAVESRQPHVYQLLLQRGIMKDSIFGAVDANGNSALHLAAMLSEHRPWLIPGAALQMQWEIKWFEFVNNSTPSPFFAQHNKQGKTPMDIFSDTHNVLVEKGGKWLTSTSESCSVVAALIATVAFATSATVPGGNQDNSGKPNLQSHPAFNVFAFSSIIALCFSITALVMFLAILTSRYQEKDFGTGLPKKLLFGLTSLFVSIGSMLVSFCAGHFLVLEDKLKYAAFPVYAVTCLPVTLFAAAQFPLYFDLVRATFQKVPQRSYRAISFS